jgi:dipeptidyl aminopeptidase/acylaminoacyl peptidase
MQVNVKSGRSKKILDLNIGNGFYVIDNSLEPRLALKPTGYKKNEIGYKNAKGNWVFEDLESAFGKMSEFSPIGFGAKNSIFYFLASFSEEPLGIYSMTVSKKGKPGAIQKVFADKNSNVLSYIWDNKNHRLISADYGLGKPKRKYFFKNELIKELQQIDQVFPEERVVLIQVSDRENVFKVHSSKRPTSFYLFDRKTKKMSEFLSSNEKVDTKKTVSSKPISFKTRDGIQIHGFLHLPKGQKTAPMLINIHGGPFGVADHWGFNGEAQFLAQRGYASLQVNFRGSGSRGEKFVNLGKEVIGTKMQYDIIDAAIWAKSEGYSNGKACLWGVSYGGYSSVMTFLMRQDLFECAIGAAGVYNLNTILKMGDIQFSELGKAHWNDMLPKTKEERFLHSPISLVEKLHKPLYIVHGKSDVRVPVAQARDLKKQLKKANKKFQYKEYKGVGHWFVDDSKRQDFFKRALRFFDENLKK